MVDETGGVLPGVTVEAASPALIEGVRTAFTDGSGRYGLEALRPGTYTVTFTLPGFSTFIREGIEIATGFSANVDATMTVGAVEETVTVSGASPVIDVQNVVHQENISNETLDILPTGRTYSGYAALTVGAQTDILGGGQDVGGTVGDTWGTVVIHGSATYDGEVMWDGMSVTASVTSGGGTGKLFFANQAAVEEVVMATGGMDAETGFGAIAMNYIPREGGNQFSFYGIANGANENMQNLNWDESLLARGLDERQVRGLRKNWDWGVGVGGPIVRDRLWFYTAHRWWGSQTYAPGSFHNGAWDNPDMVRSYGAAFYEPDFDRPTEQESTTRDNSIRLTWQASERNKITVSHADQRHCLCQFWSIFGVVDHNASMDYDIGDISNTQASWTMPASNRLLFEAGVSFMRPFADPGPQQEVDLDNDIGVWIGSQGININALMWLGANTPAIYGQGNNWPNYTARASMSYVTGSHNFKVGMTRTHVGENHPSSYILGARSYVFSEPGVPLSVRQYASPTASFQEAVLMGIYAQDQWTIDRLTLNLGVRYDRLNGWVPAQESPVGVYNPSVVTDRLRQLSQLQRPQRAAGSRLRPVRQRPDGAEVELGPLRERRRHHSGAGQEPVGVAHPQHEPVLGRPEREPGSGLRLQHPPPGERRVRGGRPPGVRLDPSDPLVRPGRAQRLEQPARQLAALGRDPARAGRGPVDRGGVLPPREQQLPRGRQPEHRAGALHRVQHHRPHRSGARIL